MRNTGIAHVLAISLAVAIVAVVAMATTSNNRALAEPIEPTSSFRLTIPKLHVDAAIVSVGVTPDGAMGAPKGPSDVGWFNQGPRPGGIGSAVIDGHSGWKDDVPAVFDDLSALVAGDKIYVEDAEGVMTTFVVRELRTYGQHENVDAVFHSSDGKAHLNLITCGGLWDAASKSYAERLVVFADKDTG